MEQANLAHPRHRAIHGGIAMVLVLCISSVLVLGKKYLNTGGP